MVLKLCRKAADMLGANPDTRDSAELKIAERFLAEQSVVGPDDRLTAKPKKEISPDSL